MNAAPLPLVATNAVSKSDYDAAKARLEVAKASVSEAQTMLGYAKSLRLSTA